MIVTACNLELRGVAAKTSPKTQRDYYIINCETEDGTPVSLYCPDRSAFPPGLKKGDMIDVVMFVKSYNGEDRISVVNVIPSEA